MLLKKVETAWAFISRVDDNGTYRITFTMDEENEKRLEAELARILKENGKSVEGAKWFASKKKDENTGKIWYGAKCKKEFTNKKGELIQRELKVYDVRAKEFEKVPSIANGAICNIAVSPYFVTYKKDYGVSLNLDSVQLLKYTEYAQENPFGDESEAYAADIPGFTETKSGQDKIQVEEPDYFK